MKVFRFVKKVFFIGLAILSDFTNASSLSCISMQNQDCKTRPQVIKLMEMNLYFFHLVLKQVNPAVVIIMLTIHMQKFVFLTLQNI